MSLSANETSAAKKFQMAFGNFRRAVCALSKTSKSTTIKQTDLYALVNSLSGSTQVMEFAKGRGDRDTLRAAVVMWRNLLTGSQPSEHSLLWLVSQSPAVISARDGMIEACDEVSKALSTDPVESSVNGVGIGHNNPPEPLVPAPGAPWREIFADHFEPPAESQQRNAAVAFLRGDDRQEWWTAIHVAVARDTWVDKTVEAAEAGALVLFHAAAAEGKTTIVRQVAHLWLAKGRRVFHLLDDSSLHDPSFREAIVWSERPLLLLDRVGLTQSKPAWVSHDFGIGGCLLISTQTRKVRDQRPRIAAPFAEIRLSPIDLNDNLDSYVDQIVGHGAAVCPDRSKTRALFQDGLNRAAGGMFAAAWQATRGKALDQRFAEMVQEFRTEDANLIALAAIAFVNVLRESDSKLADLKRSRVLGLIDALDLNADAMENAKKEISKIGATLDGEFSRDRIDYSGDPQMEVRHPSIAHGFWHHIFGRANPTIAEVISKWPFYAALADSYATDLHQSTTIISAVLTAHSKAWVHDRQHKIFHASMKDNPRLTTEKKIADLIQSHNWDATVNLSIATAALDEEILGSRPLADRNLGKDRLSLVAGDKHASANHLVTAAKLAQRHFSEDLDWTRMLDIAWVRAKRPVARRIVAHNALEICADDPNCSPEVLSRWALRTGLDDRIAQSDSYKMLDRLAERFSASHMQRRFPRFAEGGYEVDNLGSVRAIERTFWRLSSSNNKMAQSIQSMLDAGSPPDVLKRHVIRLLRRWYDRDRDRPDIWPDGAIEHLGRSLTELGNVGQFLNSYRDYFGDAPVGPQIQ